MNRELRLLIRGVGIGIILTATLFFLVMTFSVPKEESTLTDTQIIEKARTLGMIFVSELAGEELQFDSEGNPLQVTENLDE